MQILFFERATAGFLYGLTKGLYTNVAKAYNLMMDLIYNTMNFSVESITEKIYIIVGIFMMFRVAIGLVGMIINPDQVSDKNAGADKMLTRVVTSIILLLLFQPTGFLLNRDPAKELGLLIRLQSAIIGTETEPGVIDRLFSGNVNASYSSNNNSNNSIFNIYNNNLFFENVYAASRSKTCYFYHPVTESDIKPTPFYKITFYNSAGLHTDRVRVSTKVSQLWMEVKSESKNYNGTTYTFSDYEMEYYDDENDAIINWSDICDNLAFDTTINGARIYRATSDKPASGVVYGFDSIGDMTRAFKKDIENNNSIYSTIANNCSENDTHPACDVILKEDIRNEWLPGISQSAQQFAQNSLEAFQDCTTDSQECEEAKSNQFGLDGETDAIEGGEKIVDLMAEDELSLDTILALIAGIALIIFILLLCVDVVVRNLKLMLLEMLAPIPIISYVDPKDKIFNNWIKAYFSVYVDLFLKILAIKLVLELVVQISNMDKIQGLEYFFIIIGILVFAKIVPGLISKIFDLDMNGSFKEIGNMMKAGVGLAAGAAIGGAVGAATGQGFMGRTTGALGGALRGAGSGSKGKVFGGAQAISARNNKVNQQKADGLNFMDRIAVGAAGLTGMTLAGKKIEEKMKLAADANSKRKAVDDWAGDELRKKGATIKSQNVEWKTKDSNGNDVTYHGYIPSKDKSKAVTKYNETIDMKTEYARQQSLNNITMEQWNSMSQTDRMREFGDLVGSQNSYTEATVFMNDRIAALEDYGKAERINIGLASNDAEAIKVVGELRDSITEAHNAGVQGIAQVPADAKFNNTTLKGVKDQSNETYNKLAEENATALKRSKHANNK